MSKDLAFVCREITPDDRCIVSFQTRHGFSLPSTLLNTSVSEFESVLEFSSKLLDLHKDLESQYAKETFFADLLRDLHDSHKAELEAVRSEASTSVSKQIAPLLVQMTALEQQKKAQLDEYKSEYDKKLKELEKKYKTLEQEYTSFKRESEEDKAKEIKTLQKKNKELESDLHVASRSETTIRDQCQAESNRLIQMMEAKQSEIFKLRESQFIEREQRLHLKEKELESKIHRNAVSSLRGQDSETGFKELAKELMNWDLTKQPFHACDHSATIHSALVLFEHKNWSDKVQQKEINKFLRDMKENPSCVVGIFLSPVANIVGKNPKAQITMDWINTTQCAVYVQKSSEIDPDFLFQTLDQIIRIACVFYRNLESANTGSSEAIFEQRIEQAKVFVQTAISKFGTMIKKVQTDKKQLIGLIETMMSQTIQDLRHQSDELKTAIQILLGESCTVEEDEVVESIEKPKASPRKKKGSGPVIALTL
jgi:hypothetical protein